MPTSTHSCLLPLNLLSGLAMHRYPLCRWAPNRSPMLNFVHPDAEAATGTLLLVAHLPPLGDEDVFLAFEVREVDLHRRPEQGPDEVQPCGLLPALLHQGQDFLLEVGAVVVVVTRFRVKLLVLPSLLEKLNLEFVELARLPVHHHVDPARDVTRLAENDGVVLRLVEVDGIRRDGREVDLLDLRPEVLRAGLFRTGRGSRFGSCRHLLSPVG